ncbi:uncharacterized protein LOC34622890 [Cyclospora cayetanensis]|uniref:Uncharacterized protein LOC34622890 n=1 Tax=Cyclospora cayetanensis TaxID=88456 RepID=A0A6P6RVX3_9EIME|nr:uncharacterized protein LOC34622890 [Cyclospora cayetanensis]
MATSASSFGAATAVSLHKAGKALEAYLSGSLDCQQLLGCFYASAPGRRAFIEQAVASQTAARPKPLHAQLAAFAGLLSRALEAFAEAETADEGPQEGRLPTQPLEEVVFAGICATEFWLQHVQQLMALETAAAAVSVADGDGPSETGVVYKELERLVGPIAAAAAAPKLGRSLLCRLTWIWRPSPRHGDQAQQEHQQRQLHSMSGGCLFSEVLNSGGQTFPLQGAVSSSLSQLEADGGRFVLLNTQSLGETLLAAATSCCEVFAASVSAAAATLANSATKHPSASDTQLQRRSEASQQKEPPPTQQRPTRRGGKGSQKKWKKQMQQLQQQKQQQHEPGLPPPVVLESSSSSEGESSGAGSAADSDSSTVSGKKKCGKRGKTNHGSRAAVAAAAASLMASQLDELSEAELSATNAAALEAAVQAAGALAEVGGSGGVLPCLQVFCSFLETLLSTCRLLEELLYVQDVALVGSSALQLEAFIEALVLGILATNLSWNPSRGDQPLFAHVILSDPFSLVAALRLLTASISVCLPPLATLRAASSLHEQLLQLCSSGQGPLPGGFRLSSCWSLFEVPGDAHFSSSWSMLQQAAGHGPVTATGALEVALTDLGLAIRNAACTRSTEGAAAAGEAAIEAADGCASRFILRPEQLQVYQDTPAGGPKPAAALYNTCFSNSLNLSAPKVLGEPSRQGAGSCPQGSLWTSKRSSASVGGLRDIAGAHAASEAPGPSLVTKGHGDSVSEKCDTPDVGNGTYSRAAANASLSAVGAEPRRSTEDLTERSASFPPQQQHQNTPGLLLGGSLVCGEVEIEESGKKLCKRQRREQGHVSLSRSPSPYPVVIQRGDARSDDEVVILEDTTSHSAPKDKRNRFSEGRAAGEDPAIRQQQLPQATQQQPPDVSVSAEAQARARLNKLVQSDSDLSD